MSRGLDELNKVDYGDYFYMSLEMLRSVKIIIKHKCLKDGIIPPVGILIAAKNFFEMAIDGFSGEILSKEYKVCKFMLKIMESGSVSFISRKEIKDRLKKYLDFLNSIENYRVLNYEEMAIAEELEKFFGKLSGYASAKFYDDTAADIIEEI